MKTAMQALQRKIMQHVYWYNSFNHHAPSGFNCGEAVNFAIGDWFPFAAEASRRYALLRRMPIVPCEELLCKEAMFLSKSSNLEDNSLVDVKVSFACLMRLHHCARWVLKRLRATLSISPNSQGTNFCSLCKRECYVAHITCNYYSDPICLFHGITYLFVAGLLYLLLQMNLTLLLCHYIWHFHYV